jgi:hypothetical protein
MSKLNSVDKLVTQSPAHDKDHHHTSHDSDPRPMTPTITIAR